MSLLELTLFPRVLVVVAHICAVSTSTNQLLTPCLSVDLYPTRLSCLVESLVTAAIDQLFTRPL